MTFYPSVEEVIAAHARLIARFGGSLGIRDRGALESALARPQTGYYKTSSRRPQRCGRVSRRITRLLTETQRVAITVAAAFLRVNGYRVEFEDLDAYAFLMKLHETGSMHFSELEAWLRAHSSTVTSIPG